MRPSGQLCNSGPWRGVHLKVYPHEAGLRVAWGCGPDRNWSQALTDPRATSPRGRTLSLPRTQGALTVGCMQSRTWKGLKLRHS